MIDLDKTCTTKLTKIICTIGPSTVSRIKEMIENGMSILRINLSHIKTESELIDIFLEIKRIREIGEIFFGVALDTRGPEIRARIKTIGLIKKGQILTFTNEKNNECFGYINFPNIEKISVNDVFMIDDGFLKMKVVSIENKILHCAALTEHYLNQNKGVAFPGINLDIPFLDSLDSKYIRIGLEHGIDFIFVSFVSKATDIGVIRNFVGKDCPLIISKIESKMGITNIDEIIEGSDGIMVARGDLAAEIDIHKVVIAQKMIVKKCKENKKPVIVATQMMESMISNSIPTRAEVSDVSNSVLDGVDAIMLSAETSIGKNPIKCIESMSRISIASELFVKKVVSLNSSNDRLISYFQSKEIKYIVLMVVNENDIFDVYNMNICAPVIVVSQDPYFLRRLSLFRGMIPFKISFNPIISDPISYRNHINDITSFLKVKFGAQTGDLVVVYSKKSEEEKDIHEIKI